MTNEAVVFSKEEIQRIAKFQSLLCWLVVANLGVFAITSLLSFKAGAYSSVGSVFIVARLALMGAGIYFIYSLGQALKTKNLWLYIVGSFLPLIGLIVLLALIVRATKTLRSYNIRVGLMGAYKEDLNKFLGQ